MNEMPTPLKRRDLPGRSAGDTRRRGRRRQLSTSGVAEILELRVNLSAAFDGLLVDLPAGEVADSPQPSAGVLPPSAEISFTEPVPSLEAPEPFAASASLDDLLSQLAVSGLDFVGDPVAAESGTDSEGRVPVVADLFPPGQASDAQVLPQQTTEQTTQQTTQHSSPLATSLSSVSVRSDFTNNTSAVQIHVRADAPLDAETLQTLNHPVRFQLGHTNYVVSRQDVPGTPSNTHQSSDTHQSPAQPFHASDADSSEHYRQATQADIDLLNRLGFHVDSDQLNIAATDHHPQIAGHPVTDVTDRVATDATSSTSFVASVSRVTSLTRLAQTARLSGWAEASARPTSAEPEQAAEPQFDSERSVGRQQSAATVISDTIGSSDKDGDSEAAAAVDGDVVTVPLNPLMVERPLRVLAGDLEVPLDVTARLSQPLPIAYLQRLDAFDPELDGEDSLAIATFAVPPWAVMTERQPRTASMAFWLAAMTASGIAFRSAKMTRSRATRGTEPATIAARFR